MARSRSPARRSSIQRYTSCRIRRRPPMTQSTSSWQRMGSSTRWPPTPKLRRWPVPHLRRWPGPTLRTRRAWTRRGRCVDEARTTAPTTRRRPMNSPLTPPHPAPPHPNPTTTTWRTRRRSLCCTRRRRRPSWGWGSAYSPATLPTPASSSLSRVASRPLRAASKRWTSSLRSTARQSPRTSKPLTSSAARRATCESRCGATAAGPSSSWFASPPL